MGSVNVLVRIFLRDKLDVVDTADPCHLRLAQVFGLGKVSLPLLVGIQLFTPVFTLKLIIIQFNIYRFIEH